MSKRDAQHSLQVNPTATVSLCDIPFSCLLVKFSASYAFVCAKMKQSKSSVHSGRRGRFGGGGGVTRDLLRTSEVDQLLKFRGKSSKK